MMGGQDNVLPQALVLNPCRMAAGTKSVTVAEVGIEPARG